MSDEGHHASGGGRQRAPGDPHQPTTGQAVRTYIVGLLAAAGLTLASFAVAGGWGAVWGPAIPVALIALAVGQMGVHLVFFLHITTGPDNTNNVLALAFGVLIVFLVVAGSLWIMANLNHNMLPMDQMTNLQMQR